MTTRAEVIAALRIRAERRRQAADAIWQLAAGYESVDADLARALKDVAEDVHAKARRIEIAMLRENG